VRAHDLLDGLDVLSIRGDLDVEVRSVVHDSRTVQPGALFACIRGARSDGHEHARAAVAAGAVVLLVERELDVEAPQARVASVREVLGPLAARFHGDPSRALRVLGVTGTNGKTTVTYVLERIARSGGATPGRIGTLGVVIGDRHDAARHTTPESTELQRTLAAMRDAHVDIVAMEVSSHALDQHRVDGTHFAAVGFTNLSQDHLDYHRTMDEYFAAKARLFDGSFSTTAAIPIDDEYGRRLRATAGAAHVDVWTYARESETRAPDADVVARDVACTSDSTRFVLASTRDGREATVESSTLLGEFNIRNMLAAASIARASGMTFEEVVAGLRAPVRVPGRFERIEAAHGPTVIVDYAHTPDALDHTLRSARMLTGASGSLAVVYGCGGDRDRAKRPLMGAVVAALADRAYLTSDNPRSEDPRDIAAQVLAGVPAGRHPIVELDRRRAIEQAVHDARAGDVVVVAGKGHEPGQIVGDEVLPFDDRDVARATLRGATCD
jgi:UDP-N-acetylmuramoyl-L-alanyl-D-glutamate--2,6-diaminopimelate ligase